MVLRFLSSTATILVALGSLGLAAPAQAQTEPPRTWDISTTATVCVESHVGRSWNVAGAVRRWNRVDGGPRFVLADSCADYTGTVTVRYQNDDSEYTGWSKWYWDTTGYLDHVDITLNPRRIRAFASEDRSCQRQHTMTHELGHALGLRHYRHSHAGSVMSYLGWQRLCGRLSAHDRSEYQDLYPVDSVAEVATSRD